MATKPEVWAVAMVRDEADIIEHTIRHLADEAVDGFVIADNGSVDGTYEILRKLQYELAETGVRMIVTLDSEVGYYQSDKMTALAHIAAANRSAGTPDPWIIPFDADELWYCRGEWRLGDLLRDLGSIHIVEATMWNHVATSLDDDCDPNAVTRQRWRLPQPNALPKVAFRYAVDAVIEMGNHGVRLPSHQFADGGVHLTDVAHIRHYSWRSAAQLTRKAINGAQAYAASTLPETFGAHWRSWGRLIEQNGPEVMTEIFREHYWYLSPTDSGLVEDPAPFMRWQT